MKILLTTLKYIQTPSLAHKLPDIFRLFLELEDKKKGTEYLQVLLKYLTGSVNNLKEKDLKESVTKIIIEGGDMMATIAENWMAKGIEKGIEKGKIEQKSEIAIKSLREGLPVTLVSKITGLAEKELERLERQIKKEQGKKVY